MGTLGNYLHKVRRLMNLKRYQNLYLFKNRSVAEHSWSVAKIAQTLAYMEMKKGNYVDMGCLLQKAIGHDELELFTGDIISGTKRRTENMQKAVDELEQVVFEEEYSRIIPDGWEEQFRTFTLDSKDDSFEGQLLHAADVLDTVLEAIEEIELGNKPDFERVVKNSVERIRSGNLESAKELLEQILSTSRIEYEFELLEDE